jgi:hypothetical protein
VRDQVHGDTFGSGSADGHQPEHGGAVHDLTVADGGEHRRAPLHRNQSYRLRDGQEFAGQVDQVVALAGVPVGR